MHVSCVSLLRQTFFSLFFARKKHGNWVLVNGLHHALCVFSTLVSHEKLTLHCKIRLVHHIFHFPCKHSCVWRRCSANRRQRVYHNLKAAPFSLRRAPQVDLTHFQFGNWTVHVFGRFGRFDFIYFRLECGLFNVRQSKCSISRGST